VRLTAAHLALDVDKVADLVKQYVIDALTAELEAQVAMHSERRIRYHLSQYTASSSDEAGLKKGYTDLLAGLDISKIAQESRKIISDALASNQVDEILRVYNRKSLADRISTCFGLKHGEYPALVLRLLQGKDRGNLVAALRAALPQLGGA
jgi:hypothetical protein